MSVTSAEERIAALREIAATAPLISASAVLKVINGDFEPLAKERWLQEECSACGHVRKDHTGFGGMPRYPRCRRIGRRALTNSQEKRGVDDGIYCNCVLRYEKVVAKEPTHA